MKTPQEQNEKFKRMLNQDEDTVVRSLLNGDAWDLKLEDLAQLQQLEWTGQNRSRVNGAIQSLRQTRMESQQ